jgi:hypothetical protein
MFHLFLNYVAIVFLAGYCICFYTYVATVCSNCFSCSVLCCSKCFFMLQSFIWMLHMFHTYVASVYPECFICFKCMLHSNVSCCKCRPPMLVSMMIDRAKPRPPTRGGGAGRHQRCGDTAQAAWCCRGRGRGESSVQPERDGRRADVEETGGKSSEQSGQQI